MTANESSGSEPERFRPIPSSSFYKDNADLYEIAFDESVRALKDQVDELSGMRQRAVQFIAFVGSATAFLLGSGASILSGPSHPDAVFYFLTVLGSFLAAVTITYIGRLLRPKDSIITATASAQSIISNHIEIDVPAANKGELLRRLAWYNDDDVIKNDEVLVKARRRYVRSIAFGSAQLVAWALLVVWLRVSIV